MPLEIERKFLVTTDAFKQVSQSKKYIKQGFLNSDANRVVRVRIIDKNAYLTIKGKSNNSGTSRFEWEKEISVSDAQELFLLCEEGIIEKTRYFHNYKNQIIEIDVFLGDNEGLIVAEVELKHENDHFEKPNYFGKEVTGEKKYYNAVLSKNPFKHWHKKTSN